MEDLLTRAGTDIAAEELSLESLEVTSEFVRALQRAVRVHWGENPHDRPPRPNWTPFTPPYIAILYLGLTAGWEIVVNHACFTTSVINDDDNRRAKAVAILEEKRDLGGIPLGELDPENWGTYLHQLPGHDRPYDSGSFSDFNFRSQNELFIYLEDPDIVLEEDDVIGFKPDGDSPRPKDINSSYFYAKPVPQTEMGSLTGKMIRVRNYMTKDDGAPIGAMENRDYSIDIKFRVDAGEAGMITMIIDPDTGNGAGHEP